MARHNPILGRDPAFTGDRGYAGFETGAGVDDRQQQYGYAQPPTYGQQGATGQYGQQGFDQQFYGQQTGGRPDPYAHSTGADEHQLEALYASPAATGYQTGRLTMVHALNAISMTLGTIIVVGLAVMIAPRALSLVSGEDVSSYTLPIGFVAFIPGLIGGFILGLVNSFKKRPSAVLTLLYAVFEGLLLGGLSLVMEHVYPGIAIQAVGATFAVAGTVFVLFRAGILRTSARLNRIAAVAGLAYLVFLLANLGIGFFTGTFIYNGVLGLVVGALAVVLCSYMLVGDLEDVQRGVRNGVPREYAWRCAYALASTLVWMYIEIIRILSILRD